MSFFRHIPGIKGTGGGGGGYEVGQSLLFDKHNENGYLNLAKTSDGPSVYTISLWMKPVLGGASRFMSARGTSDTGLYELIDHSPTGVFSWTYRDGPSIPGNLAGIETTSVFRDPSAWLHVVFSRNGLTDWKIFVNGVEQELNIVYPLIQSGNYLNTKTFPTRIGHQSPSTTIHVNQYQAETHFIDGQALEPTPHFAVEDDDGNYNPVKYTGTYGTNGFYLPFKAGDIGGDSSPNGNNFTVSGLTDDDIVADSPTNNFCTWNPLNAGSNTTSTGTLSNGNLRASNVGQSISAYWDIYGTIPVGPTGKWYFENTIEAYNTPGTNVYCGFTDPALIVNTTVPMNHIGSIWWDMTTSNPFIRVDGSDNGAGYDQPYGSRCSTGDVVGIAMDMDNSTFEGFKNGVSQGIVDLSATTIPGRVLVPGETIHNSGLKQTLANFGQRTFAHTPPEGYKALNSQNMENT